MANVQTSNKIYIDSTGLLTDTRIKVSYILFTPNAANDELILRETASGPTCLHLRASVAKNTVMYDCSRSPMVFGNGMYIDTLTSGAHATIVTTEKGQA